MIPNALGYITILYESSVTANFVLRYPRGCMKKTHKQILTLGKSLCISLGLYHFTPIHPPCSIFHMLPYILTWFKCNCLINHGLLGGELALCPCALSPSLPLTSWLGASLNHGFPLHSIHLLPWRQVWGWRLSLRSHNPWLIRLIATSGPL